MSKNTPLGTLAVLYSNTYLLVDSVYCIHYIPEDILLQLHHLGFVSPDSKPARSQPAPWTKTLPLQALESAYLMSRRCADLCCFSHPAWCCGAATLRP